MVNTSLNINNYGDIVKINITNLFNYFKSIIQNIKYYKNQKMVYFLIDLEDTHTDSITLHELIEKTTIIVKTPITPKIKDTITDAQLEEYITEIIEINANKIIEELQELKIYSKKTDEMAQKTLKSISEAQTNTESIDEKIKKLILEKMGLYLDKMLFIFYPPAVDNIYQNIINGYLYFEENKIKYILGFLLLIDNTIQKTIEKAYNTLKKAEYQFIISKYKITKDVFEKENITKKYIFENLYNVSNLIMIRFKLKEIIKTFYYINEKLKKYPEYFSKEINENEEIVKKISLIISSISRIINLLSKTNIKNNTIKITDIPKTLKDVTSEIIRFEKQEEYIQKHYNEKEIVGLDFVLEKDIEKDDEEDNSFKHSLTNKNIEITPVKTIDVMTKPQKLEKILLFGQNKKNDFITLYSFMVNAYKLIKHIKIFKTIHKLIKDKQIIINNRIEPYLQVELEENNFIRILNNNASKKFLELSQKIFLSYISELIYYYEMPKNSKEIIYSIENIYSNFLYKFSNFTKNYINEINIFSDIIRRSRIKQDTQEELETINPTLEQEVINLGTKILKITSKYLLEIYKNQLFLEQTILDVVFGIPLLITSDKNTLATLDSNSNTVIFQKTLNKVYNIEPTFTVKSKSNVSMLLNKAIQKEIENERARSNEQVLKIIKMIENEINEKDSNLIFENIEKMIWIASLEVLKILVNNNKIKIPQEIYAYYENVVNNYTKNSNIIKEQIIKNLIGV